MTSAWRMPHAGRACRSAHRPELGLTNHGEERQHSALHAIAFLSSGQQAQPISPTGRVKVLIPGGQHKILSRHQESGSEVQGVQGEPCGDPTATSTDTVVGPRSRGSGRQRAPVQPIGLPADGSLGPSIDAAREAPGSGHVLNFSGQPGP